MSEKGTERDRFAGRVSRCRECGRDLGAGYLCDSCDIVEGWE